MSMRVLIQIMSNYFHRIELLYLYIALDVCDFVYYYVMRVRKRVHFYTLFFSRFSKTTKTNRFTLRRST